MRKKFNGTFLNAPFRTTDTLQDFFAPNHIVLRPSKTPLLSLTYFQFSNSKKICHPKVKNSKYWQKSKVFPGVLFLKSRINFFGSTFYSYNIIFLQVHFLSLNKVFYFILLFFTLLIILLRSIRLILKWEI